MLRMRTPNGILTSHKMQVLAKIVQRYGLGLMWLIDQWGIAKFRFTVEKQFAHPLALAAEKDEINWDKRDHIIFSTVKQ